MREISFSTCRVAKIDKFNDKEWMTNNNLGNKLLCLKYVIKLLISTKSSVKL